MIVICQGGQTGVDRGAWLGAVECGIARGGWMPANERDELGRIPYEVRRDLRPMLSGGPRERTIANVNDAHAVVIVVPDASSTPREGGTALTYRLAKSAASRGLRWIMTDIDDTRDLDEWCEDVFGSWRGGDLRLMVAGPRASKWSDGEDAARRVVRIIAKHARRFGLASEAPAVGDAR